MQYPRFSARHGLYVFPLGNSVSKFGKRRVVSTGLNLRTSQVLRSTSLGITITHVSLGFRLHRYSHCYNSDYSEKGQIPIVNLPEKELRSSLLRAISHRVLAIGGGWPDETFLLASRCRQRVRTISYKQRLEIGGRKLESLRPPLFVPTYSL